MKKPRPIKKEDLNPNPLPISLPLPATTTEQQDLTVLGQRRINIIWEVTQAMIAIAVTLATILSVFMVAVGFVTITSEQTVAMMQLVGMDLLILGFYFSRTNHEKIGGIGIKTSSPYKGR